MAARSLEADLDAWKNHVKMYVQLARQTLKSSAKHESQLQEGVQLAKNTLHGLVAAQSNYLIQEQWRAKSNWKLPLVVKPF